MNLKEKIFISYCTTHLGCLLMGGISLLLFCGIENNNNYSKEESFSYALLPELYSVTPSNVISDSDISQISVDIKFNSVKVFTDFKKNDTKYIIPLRFESDEVRIVKAQPDLMLEVTINYPKVKFVSYDVSSISVNKKITTVKMPIAFKYMVNENIIASLCDFSCKLSILKNAGEMIIANNQSYNIGYELLPQSSYTLKEIVNYKTRDTQAKKILSIARKKELEIKKCLFSFAQTDYSDEYIKRKTL